ncbi:MAG TPA: FtsX-like permease family protein [Acidimicrobiales bacterium]|nr:FtsX-like permease family protein [Acidimicrobiales bacterium]
MAAVVVARPAQPLAAAIALIIALGTGTFAGLGSTATWRRQSNDASFALLRMHDLRVTLPEGATVAETTLSTAIDRLPHADWVTARAERLVGSTQVDASGPGHTVLTPGEVVGITLDASASDLAVDGLHRARGRTLRADDDGRPVAVLEQSYAEHFDLPATGALTVSGGKRLDYVGTGTSPQHFIVTGPRGMLFAEANFATLFVPLHTAQEILGRAGQVNEAVLRVSGTADLAKLERELTAALPDVGLTFTRRADEPAVRMLYEDIDNDQQFWNVIGGLVLAGATFAAFNLTSRMIDAQRRQLGVGMALGTPAHLLALRPLLVGVQIAALGVVAGVAVGYLLDVWLRGVFSSVLPLPIWHTPFQPAVFARAAALGFVLPVAAAAVPVWRAVRVEPVEAIRVGHLAPARRGVLGLAGHTRWRGRITRRMPVRNILRAPRRALLTALAIGAAITTMVATIGLIDSFVETLDRGEAEATHHAADRFIVELDGFYPRDAPELRELAALPEVRAAEPRLRLYGTASPAAPTTDQVELILELVDFDAGMWSPTLTAGNRTAVTDGGLVLAEKAADDLHVTVGDRVAVRHPRRVGASYELVTTQLTVAALQPGPLRSLAFLDINQARVFNLTGLTNVVDIRPRAGVSDDTLVRAVFVQPGVASVESVTATVRAVREALEDFFGVLRVVEAVVLLLAVLIAFNATSIGIDEGARQHATMLAFGLGPRTVLSIAAAEMAAIGLIGTLLGLAGGRAVLAWVTSIQLQRTMPDVRVDAYLAPGTLLTAAVLGILAVAAAPLLLTRRIQTMDVPATLRVLE